MAILLYSSFRPIDGLLHRMKKTYFQFIFWTHKLAWQRAHPEEGQYNGFLAQGQYTHVNTSFFCVLKFAAVVILVVPKFFSVVWKLFCSYWAPGFLERCTLLSNLDGFPWKLHWRVIHSKDCSSQLSVFFKVLKRFVIEKCKEMECEWK